MIQCPNSFKFLFSGDADSDGDGIKDSADDDDDNDGLLDNGEKYFCEENIKSSTECLF